MVTSRSRRRFALASELGADATHATVDGPLADAARRFSGREGVDLVVETAGTAEAVTHALELVRPGGRVVLTGCPTSTSVSFFPVVRREVTLIGSMIYQDEFPEALRLVDSGAVENGAAHHASIRPRPDPRRVRRTRGPELHQGRPTSRPAPATPSGAGPAGLAG